MKPIDLIKHSFFSPAGLISNYLSSFPNGGLFLARPEKLELWQQFRLSFNLPGEEKRIECPVEVLWVNRVAGEFPVGVGVMFTGLNPEDRRRLDNYIRTWGRRDELMNGRMVRIFPMDETGAPEKAAPAEQGPGPEGVGGSLE